MTDQSVSRGKNAPKLEGHGPSEAALKVPEGCISRVLAIQGFRFNDLQQGLAAGPEFQVTPADMKRRFCLVNAPDLSLYLARSLQSNGAGPTHHLVALPPALRVAPGSELSLYVPSIVVVGAGAVELLPGETVLPDSQATELPAAHSIRVPNVGVTKTGAALLDEVDNPPLPSVLRIGKRDEPFTAEALDGVAAEVLSKLKRHYAFVPALVEERDPRLLLVYERNDGSVRGLLSDGHIAAWLEHIDGVLASADFPHGARPSSAPPPASFPAPASLPARPSSLPVPPAEMQGPAQRPGGSSRVLPEPVMFGPIQTRSADFADALVSARYAAEGDLGLFILGETGTGKEHLARAVHDASPRAKGPFVAINCASIPEPQIESELVGHKKRSFSGAEGNRDGAFMTANGGTLLLDEIGDAPSRVQYALLRVLESRTVKPVGSDHERPFDVRAIAATSRDVMRLMREGKLREDVYFRLAEQSVVIPPLRERVCDIRSMAESMLKALGCDKPLSAEAISLLERYRWPGNVREFRHALNRAMVIAKKSSAELNARCFPHLDQVVTSFGEEAPPFDFPDLVVGVAMLVWKDKSLDETRVRSKYERRAVQRAALLYLARVYQVQAFPAALMLHWTRLFGERWATTENGRGAKELLRVLGRLPTDRAALEWILWKVGRG